MDSFRPPKAAFTLIELLVATAVLCLVLVALVGMANSAGKMWTQGESLNQHRQRARAVLDFMAKELRMAALPMDGGTNSLELVITNLGAPGSDSIFWQAPIATETSQGDLAEVGYFVRWDGTQGNLCRFFVNPSDTNNYLIYRRPSDWVNADVLQTNALADKANKYQGLFLENIVGMWVKAVTNSYDSRSSNSLPGTVTISLALLDSSTARRVTNSSQLIALRQGSDSATNFVANLPASLRPGASIVTTVVSLKNAR